MARGAPERLRTLPHSSEDREPRAPRSLASALPGPASRTRTCSGHTDAAMRPRRAGAAVLTRTRGVRRLPARGRSPFSGRARPGRAARFRASPASRRTPARFSVNPSRFLPRIRASPLAPAHPLRSSAPPRAPALPARVSAQPRAFRRNTRAPAHPLTLQRPTARSRASRARFGATPHVSAQHPRSRAPPHAPAPQRALRRPPRVSNHLPRFGVFRAPGRFAFTMQKLT